MVIWRFEDDCLVPERRIRLDFTGPNPFRIHGVIRGMLERIFEVEAIDLWERDFRWDIVGDPRTFYMRFYVNKGVDAYTAMFVEITIQGEQPSDPTKIGRVTIFIGGRLITLYDLDTAFKQTPFYKFLRWLHHRLFYNEVRRGYLRLCVELIGKLIKELKEVYGMPVPARPM